MDSTEKLTVVARDMLGELKRIRIALEKMAAPEVHSELERLYKEEILSKLTGYVLSELKAHQKNTRPEAIDSGLKAWHLKIGTIATRINQKLDENYTPAKIGRCIRRYFKLSIVHTREGYQVTWNEGELDG